MAARSRRQPTTSPTPPTATTASVVDFLAHAERLAVIHSPGSAADLTAATPADPDLRPSPAVPSRQQFFTLRAVRSRPEESPRAADTKEGEAAGDGGNDDPKGGCEFFAHRGLLLPSTREHLSRLVAANKCRLPLAVGQTGEPGNERGANGTETKSCVRAVKRTADGSTHPRALHRIPETISPPIDASPTPPAATHHGERRRCGEGGRIKVSLEGSPGKQL